MLLLSLIDNGRIIHICNDNLYGCQNRVFFVNACEGMESCLVQYGIYGNRRLRPLERIIKFNDSLIVLTR
ncbi:hypothetical protein J7K07_00325 [Candidatus Bathyarchaeota archaeon]|nr:hypothetical protein [Candidatus Bathyarchaeota archaeon]